VGLWGQEYAHEYTVANASRAKVEKFRITKSLPEDRAKVLEHTTRLMMNSGLVHTLKNPPSHRSTGKSLTVRRQRSENRTKGSGTSRKLKP
jgi:hypothetical protein